MTENKKVDKAARIALAIHRAGGDADGNENSIHRDFIDILRDLHHAKEALREIDVRYQMNEIELPPGLYAVIKAALI